MENDNLTKFLSIFKNVRLIRFIYLGIAGTMFLFISVLPILSYGYNHPIGLGFVFGGYLSLGWGFSRFLVGLMLLLPLVIAAREFFARNPISRTDDILNAILFGIGVVLFILFAVTMPFTGGTSMGSTLYLILSLLGLGMSLLPVILKKRGTAFTEESVE